MNLEDLKVGRYVLTEDVENNLVDRRKAGWKGNPVIRKGKIIHVRDDAEELDSIRPVLILCIGSDRVNVLMRPRRKELTDFTERCEFYDALVESMKKAPPKNAKELVDNLEAQYLHVGALTLQRLIDKGKISLRDIEKAARNT